MNTDALILVPLRVTSKECYQTIQEALNKLVLQWHPDLNADPRSLRMTRRILKAKAQADWLYYGLILKSCDDHARRT